MARKSKLPYLPRPGTVVEVVQLAVSSGLSLRADHKAGDLIAVSREGLKSELIGPQDGTSTPAYCCDNGSWGTSRSLKNLSPRWVFLTEDDFRRGTVGLFRRVSAARAAAYRLGGR